MNKMFESLEKIVQNEVFDNWADIMVNSEPIEGDFSIVIKGNELSKEDKGFWVSLRQGFNTDIGKVGKTVLTGFVLYDGCFDKVYEACNKLILYLKDCLKEVATPIYAEVPFGTLTKEKMQPLLDAINCGNFELAAELTPSRYRLCGYQEFDNEHIHKQYGHGWAGQFESTLVGKGRWPIFASKYDYHEKYRMYMNELKDFQGLTIYMAGQCISDDVKRAPEEYPFDNTIFETPYCHAIAKGILDGNSSIRLISPFKAETVHFTGYDGVDRVTYRIVDESLPSFVRLDPMELRNKCEDVRRSVGLSNEARRLYDKFLSEFKNTWGTFRMSLSLKKLFENGGYSKEALFELVAAEKIQECENKPGVYELVPEEKIRLFHSEQISGVRSEPFKFKKIYDELTSKEKAPLIDARIHNAGQKAVKKSEEGLSVKKYER